MFSHLLRIFLIWGLSLQLGWAVELKGSLTQGGLVIGHTEPKAQVFLDNQPIQISESGLFLLGFGRDAKPNSVLEIILSNGTKETKKLNIIQREYKIQRINGVSESKVTPNNNHLARIQEEAALVKKARTTNDHRTDFLTGFIWPAEGPITGVYGSQRILNSKPKIPHYGVDIAAPAGTIVKAPAAGIVTLAHPNMFLSGGTLILDHGYGLSSAFLHLQQTLVRKGERVEQGTPIAKIGATGRVTGAHLDWRINLFQTRLDPQLLVPPMGRINKE
ncbi:M23 family metallopeptidase [Candidatus Nitrosacidococcus tergens]|uniref:Peptidase M23 n=1 Tax=Candidatus Nitrosacidococcus tergens TaxID=553981 RepID=A0A7G1Q8F5_9GAMM|nr:M23 family metallopeptidase [Candidatus Nitrosacidococcus tergens]CAB1274704.1 Peptidase M23 [Candidatus Nitrosacidococcus tergens]